VLKPGRSLEVLATNTLANGFMASPAVDGKALYLRTKTHLYRIESLPSGACKVLALANYFDRPWMSGKTELTVCRTAIELVRNRSRMGIPVCATLPISPMASIA
jgi:hypothetical protein